MSFSRKGIPINVPTFQYKKTKGGPGESEKSMGKMFGVTNGGTNPKNPYYHKITIPGNAVFPGIIAWLRREDLNLRPSGYESENTCLLPLHGVGCNGLVLSISELIAPCLSPISIY
jgi:hypothetical protein